MLHELIRISCSKLSINETTSNCTNLPSHITTAGTTLRRSVTEGEKKTQQLVSNLTQLKVNIFAWHHDFPFTTPHQHMYTVKS